MEQKSVNEKKYNIIRPIGKGKGGYSYLVTEACSSTPDRQYVLKQIHHEPCSYYSFGNKILSEKNDYSRLKKTGIRMPILIDLDEPQERILKEYIDGPTIYDLVLCDRMQECYLRQVRLMCQELSQYHLNIDYFPTNFVVQYGLIYYIDYECNDYMDEWNFENWGIKYWSKTREFLKYVKEQKQKEKQLLEVV